MTRRGLLIVLSAPSGGGKTTICRELLKRDRRLTRSVSATTRPPRGRERDGVDYFFLGDRRFDRLIETGRFLEWARVHGHRYGTLAAEVRRQQRAGRDVVLVIDVQGGLAVRRQDPRAVLIFLQPPSLEVLERRLRGRGTDDEPMIRRRLAHARWEQRLSGHYDYLVENRRLPEAVANIQAIVTAERLRNRTARRTAP